MSKGKKYIDSAKLIDSTKQYDPEELVALVKQTAKAKFDETIEVSLRLGVDPRHADQQVRGTVVLPNGTGKTVRTNRAFGGRAAPEEPRFRMNQNFRVLSLMPGPMVLDTTAERM